MSEAAETLDGWYSLHLFYAVDWATFRLVPEDEREAMINEFKVFIKNKATAREKQAGDYALYNIQTYSYVSVIELGNYLAGKSDEDPYENPHIKARLYPELPRTEYICFYPMDKRRNETYNWYMLPMEDRKKLMYNHGMIGRKFAGKIKQFITGSVGFDDFEWGVTLFSDDVLQFKKIVYEMRFDETTARYGDFGSFYIGHILTTDHFDQFFAI